MRGPYLLILITLTLFLGAKKDAVALKQSRNQGHKAESYQKNDAAKDEQTISPAFYTAILGALRSMIDEEVAKQRQEHADHEDWNTKPFWLTFGLNALLVIVGCAYTIVAYRQLSAIRTESEIAKESANAARKSAEATRAALHSNRPYLLVIEVKQPNPDDAYFVCKNAGAGPADIVEIIADLKLFVQPPDLPPALYIPRVDYSVGKRIVIHNLVITSGDQSERFFVEGYGIFDDLGPSRLGFYGRVKYRGGPPDEIYLTHFFWWHTRTISTNEGTFFIGPEELNRRS